MSPETASAAVPASPAVMRSAAARIARQQEFGVVCALLVLMAILAVVNDRFLTTSNLLDVLSQTAFIGTLACGMALVLVMGEYDLSVGGVAAAGGVAGAYLMTKGVPAGAAVLLAIGLGAALGTVNGSLIVLLGLPSFIVTLGMLGIARGSALALTDGRSIVGLGDSWLFDLGYGDLFGIPWLAIVMIVFALICEALLRGSVLGFNLYAIGGNLRAAALAGIRVRSIKIAVFAFMGGVASLVGMMLVAQFQTGEPVAASGYELDVLAAAILGGCRLGGGRGSVLGAVLGALIVAVVRNGLVFIGISDQWQTAVIGVVMILVVLIDRLAARRQATA